MCFHVLSLMSQPLENVHHMINKKELRSQITLHTWVSGTVSHGVPVERLWVTALTRCCQGQVNEHAPNWDNLLNTCLCFQHRLVRRAVSVSAGRLICGAAVGGRRPFFWANFCIPGAYSVFVNWLFSPAAYFLHLNFIHITSLQKTTGRAVPHRARPWRASLGFVQWENKTPGDGFKAVCWQGSCVFSVKADEKVEVQGCTGKKKKKVLCTWEACRGINNDIMSSGRICCGTRSKFQFKRHQQCFFLYFSFFFQRSAHVCVAERTWTVRSDQQRQEASPFCLWQQRLCSVASFKRPFVSAAQHYRDIVFVLMPKCRS